MSIKTFRAIQKKFGKSYYFATKLFPKKTREAIYTLYAFVRIPDEFVDNPEVNTPALEKLLAWREEWRKAHHTKQSIEPVLAATAQLFAEYKIPYQYSEDFLAAMLQDTEKTRYSDYKDLEHYMYGSAAVIGLMLTYLIGFQDPRALRYAEALGYAMQLTNFLRDIKEDYERGRIYMPQSELNQYGLSDADIADGKVSEKFIKFMKFQIARADNYYEEARKGLALLPCRGAFGVRVAASLYREILRKIEAQGYDVFKQRAHTTNWEKIKILITEAGRRARRG